MVDAVGVVVAQVGVERLDMRLAGVDRAYGMPELPDPATIRTDRRAVVERSLSALTGQAAVFCSAPCASFHVVFTSRGVR